MGSEEYSPYINDKHYPPSHLEVSSRGHLESLESDLFAESKPKFNTSSLYERRRREFVDLENRMHIKDFEFDALEYKRILGELDDAKAVKGNNKDAAYKLKRFLYLIEVSLAELSFRSDMRS